VIRRKANVVHYGQPREFSLCGASGKKVSMWGAVTCPTCKKIEGERMNAVVAALTASPSPR